MVDSACMVHGKLEVSALFLLQNPWSTAEAHNIEVNDILVTLNDTINENQVDNLHNQNNKKSLFSCIFINSAKYGHQSESVIIMNIILRMPTKLLNSQDGSLEGTSFC